MKSITVNYIIVLFLAISVNMACQHVADQQAKAEASYNKCPYEGYECPNAQKYINEHEECMDAMDSTYIALTDSITKLNIQLAGCEFADHSKLVKTFTIVTVDTTIPNWREYAMLLKY